MGIPAEGLIRISQILGNKRTTPPTPAIIPISRGAWYAGVKSGHYPKPVHLGVKTVAWKVSDILALADGTWVPDAENK
jgi:predicted DNA-binding transcriptional regulator AlpA